MIKTIPISTKTIMNLLLRLKYFKILRLFFNNPSKEFYVNEVKKETQLSPNIVCKELKNLTNKGILKSEKKANSLYYKSNNQDYTVKELKRLYFIMQNQLKETINDLFKKPQIKKVIIYGSMVKGDYDEESDIDICLIGIKIPKIDKEQYEKIFKRKIQLISLSISEFEKLKDKDLAFYIELQKGVQFEREI